MEPRVLLENERVRVTEWRLAPGEATGRHRHERDYLVVPLASGRVRLVEEGEAEPVTAELEAGRPTYRKAGHSHDVVNDNPGELVFIEVELR
jgi:mannose-6-phosphate isomerase-like protein (cupin superfamily)